MEPSNTFKKACNLYAKGKSSKVEQDKFFIECFNLLLNCKPDEVKLFVTETNCHRHNASRFFWESNIPYQFRKTLFDKKNIEQMLQSYFKHPGSKEHVSTVLIEYLANAFSKDLIKAVRKTRSFDSEKHLQSLKQIKNRVPQEVVIATKEWEAFEKERKRYEEKGNYYEVFLEQCSLEELLIHFTAHHERFKRRNHKNRNNRQHVVSIEVNTIYVLNKLLGIKKRSTNPIGRTLASEAFQKELEVALPPKNTFEALQDPMRLPKEKLSDTQKLFEELIDFYFQWHTFSHYIDLYSEGYAKVAFLDDEGIEWEMMPKHAHFKRNDKKNEYAEYYFLNRAIEKLGHGRDSIQLTERQIELVKATSLQYFESQFLPKKIPLKKEELDIQQLFLFLHSFSTYLMPEDNHWISLGDKVMKVDNPSAKHPLLPKNYLVRFEDKSLANSVCKVFGWSLSDSQKLVDFVTLDFDQGKGKVDILDRPLIKIGSHFYWCSTFLRDRSWATIIHKRVLLESLLDKTPKEHALELEGDLAEAFINAGFEATSSWVYEIDRQTKPEIDVLAFENDTLFIIEMKTTYPSENLQRDENYVNKKLAGKAVAQVQQGVEFIENNYDSDQVKSLKEKLGISTSLDNIKIIPLVVSNIFDADDVLPGSDILKVSTLELSIILSNQLYWLLNKSGTMIPSSLPIEEDISIQAFERNNENARGFKNNKIDTSKIRCNLWSSPEKCSAHDLLDALNKDKVWSFLDELWDFEAP